MAELGMTPEETCVQHLLRHRLQRQVKRSVFPHGHCSLCSCHTHGRNRWQCGGRQNVQEQLLNSSSYRESWPSAFGWHNRASVQDTGGTHRAGTRQTPWHRGHAWALAAFGCLCSTRLCFGTTSVVSRTDCQWWHKLHTTYGCSAPAALLATAHNVPLRSNSPGTQ